MPKSNGSNVPPMFSDSHECQVEQLDNGKIRVYNRAGSMEAIPEYEQTIKSILEGLSGSWDILKLWYGEGHRVEGTATYDRALRKYRAIVTHQESNTTVEIGQYYHEADAWKALEAIRDAPGVMESYFEDPSQYQGEYQAQVQLMIEAGPIGEMRPCIDGGKIFDKRCTMVFPSNA